MIENEVWGIQFKKNRPIKSFGPKSWSFPPKLLSCEFWWIPKKYIRHLYLQLDMHRNAYQNYKILQDVTFLFYNSTCKYIKYHVNPSQSKRLGSPNPNRLALKKSELPRYPPILHVSHVSPKSKLQIGQARQARISTCQNHHGVMLADWFLKCFKTIWDPSFLHVNKPQKKKKHEIELLCKCSLRCFRLGLNLAWLQKASRGRSYHTTK